MQYISVANATGAMDMEAVSTSLFDGVTKEEYAAMMVCFKTVIKTYKRVTSWAWPTRAWPTYSAAM